ncbi:uncharacterized protein SAPINGB_P004826 [Magnusiomyces paraingens]|uniref:Anaphase-promoting complex subunit 4 WD40 domain-containing protein n=1 Tax=Magnusiomyces paraingens TaxID=2606893 RepID=A0A5E8BZR8_9ASCO|nr:uncharacterized protein SAPINGB_P004826 [Saprochaete ingens]VVT56115.1 unnamed protein product [Saprochaete ingens]
MIRSNGYQSLQSGASGFATGHVGAINALDIEQQYSRYLLSAGADSSIKIWDLGEKRLPLPKSPPQNEGDNDDNDGDNDDDDDDDDDDLNYDNSPSSFHDETSSATDAKASTNLSRKRAASNSSGTYGPPQPPTTFSKKRRITSSASHSSLGSNSKPFKYSLVAQVPRKTHHRFGVSAIQWYPEDAGLFVSASFDHTVKAWDAETLDPVYSFNLEHRVYSAHVAPDSAAHALIATATESPLLRLLDLRSAAAAHTLKGHGAGGLRSVRWAPTQAHLLASGGTDGTVRLWDIRQSKACLDILDVYRTQADIDRNTTVKKGSICNRTTNSSPNNNATPAANLSTKIFSHRGTVNSLLWLPNSENLLSAGTDDEIRLWAIPDYSIQQQKLQRSTPRAHNTLLNYGRLVSNRFPQTLYMCIAHDCGVENEKGEENQFNSSRINKDSEIFFFPSDSGQILVFDVFSGHLLNRLDRRTREGIYATDIPRTTCITSRGREPSSLSNSLKNSSLEYYSGALDGTITRWVVSPPSTLQENDYNSNQQHSQDSSLLQNATKNVDFNENEDIGGDGYNKLTTTSPTLDDAALIKVTTTTNDAKDKDSDESNSDNDYEWAGNALASLK